MKCYKGFDKDLKCRGFQFELGGEYEEPKADLCNKGFHACENPLDVFNYYAPSDSRYCEVELEEVSEQRDADSKICGKRIKIGAEIGLKGIVEAGVKFIFDKVDWKNSKISNSGNYSAATNTGYKSVATNTGDCSAATNSGNYSAATNSGNYSAATNTGYRSAATNTGNCSAATNTGDCSAATNTGNKSVATNTGYKSVATNSGYKSAATNSGDNSAAINSGDRSAAEVSGKDSVAIVTGCESRAKAALGCAIVIAERGKWNGTTYPLINIKSAIVDGEIIKADTWYTVKDNELVEVR
ncbi:MAG: hypothetical protein II306_02955 [Clostridia bacterium]|nr:hypothetical protein [Clostridia bacterium]